MAIPATELARMQADAAACVFDTTCQIQRMQTPSLVNGRKTGGFTQVVAAQPCNFMRPSLKVLSAIASEVAALNLWDVTMARGANVQKQDHVIVNGQTLTVQDTTDIESFGVLLHVLCSEAS